MTLEMLLVGGAAAILGLAFCFAGYPLFLILLPLWGFLTGFIASAGGVSESLGGGFLATGTGVVVGVGVGILMAVLAYAFWWAAILILGLSVGYLLGAGLVEALGLGPGLLTFAVGAAGAAILAIVFFVIRLPRLAAIVVTAGGGAAMAVAGALVAFGAIPLDDFATGPVRVLSTAGPLAILAAVVLAVVGIGAQLQLSGRSDVVIWRGALGAGDEEGSIEAS
jgi:hypothetical protein